MSDDRDALTSFSGIVRLFPLPNLVLYPQVVQPLHIFEPRYRQMTADALAGDRLIAMALLRPGWEAEYDSRPAIYSVACLGKIVADQLLDDGRFNILFRGLGRIRILEETKTDRLYRSARAGLLLDQGAVSPKKKQELRQQIGQQLPAWFVDQEPVIEQFHKLIASDLPLGTLCDILAFALALEVEFKQTLLEQLDVEQRVHQLLEHMTKHNPRLFPPRLSDN